MLIIVIYTKRARSIQRVLPKQILVVIFHPRTISKENTMQKYDTSKHIEIIPYINTKGYDPEMLFVECAKCGNPIIWEKGRSTEILEGAGIDPLELDAQCLLVTDGCPRCSRGGLYNVQIFRVQSPAKSMSPVGLTGNA